MGKSHFTLKKSKNKIRKFLQKLLHSDYATQYSLATKKHIIALFEYYIYAHMHVIVSNKLLCGKRHFTLEKKSKNKS